MHITRNPLQALCVYMTYVPATHCVQPASHLAESLAVLSVAASLTLMKLAGRRVINSLTIT